MSADKTDRAAYESLTRVFNQVIALAGAQNRLFRDMQTTLPKGGAADHDLETRVMTEIAHEKIADPRVKQWLDEAESHKDALSTGEQANLAAMRRWHRREASLPVELAGALKQAEGEGERLHTEHKDKGDWESTLPFFRKQLALQQRMGELLKKETGAASAYDALLDAYSAGWTTADYDKLFDDLEPFLKKLLPQVVDKQSAEGAPLPIQGPFNTASEEKLCREVAGKMGFDLDRGVMYFIPDHPCAGGTLNDVRVAGRPDPEGFVRPLYDMIHELGHGLYDQNRPKAWAFQPAGEALGMDVHESQSLIWEFVVGKSRAFNRFIAGRAQEIFGRPGDPTLSAENLEKQNQHVTPNLIRIDMETSEVTYLLHIIMRYRLEKQMINGTLDPADLPAAWNKMSKDMFGREPKDNAEGCMQDVHWFCGLWGYFPSYALGYMGAVQLFDAAVKDDPAIPAKIEKGEFLPLKDWLTEHVHSKGSLVTAKQLIKDATGEELSADPLKAHLKARYLDEETPKTAAIKPKAPGL
jgi:carboxypeptidase Taq